MITRAAVVAEARTWLDTRFRHQGRTRGLSADCAGLILGVGHALGILEYDAPPTYGRKPDGNEMQRILERYFDPRAIDAYRPGDVLLFAFTGEPQHLGIASYGGVIHIYAEVKRCVEHPLDEIWRARLRGVYSFKGVEVNG